MGKITSIEVFISDSKIPTQISPSNFLKIQVWNLQPHTAKDFNVRGLADRIRDLEQLHFVYTQDERVVGKEEMFQRYYSKAPNPPSQPSDGYVKAEIQVTRYEK